MDQNRAFRDMSIPTAAPTAAADRRRSLRGRLLRTLLYGRNVDRNRQRAGERRAFAIHAFSCVSGRSRSGW